MLGRGQCPVTPRRLIFWRQFGSSTAIAPRRIRAFWLVKSLLFYRPRHPEATVFYQTFEQHFDSYVRAYEQLRTQRARCTRCDSGTGEVSKMLLTLPWPW